MPPTQPSHGGGRETRLLLVTIAVSVGALLLLARFRFPEQAAQPADPAPAPLERLAARAAYDELASTMADLERRIAPRVVVLRVTPERAAGAYIVAPRVAADRAIAVLGPDETIDPVRTEATLISHDTERRLAVFGVPASEEGVMTARATIPRQGPQYVVVVEGTAGGATIRPVYIGRAAPIDVLNGGSLIALETVQPPVPPGAAVFSLDGNFMGLVGESGPLRVLIGAEALRTAAAIAQPSPPRARGSLGLEVQASTPAMLRAAKADAGVVVSYVIPEGPAADNVIPGDVIKAIDGNPTHTVDAYLQLERTRTPGEPVVLTVARRGSELQIAYAAADAAAPAAPGSSGLTGRTVAGVGVEVVTVHPNSAAAQSGLRRGDLILTIDGKPAGEMAALVRAYRALEPKAGLVLGIQRGPVHRVLMLEKP